VKLGELHPVWREALAVHEAFRRLGFTPDEIVVAKIADGLVIVGLQNLNYGWAVRTRELARDLDFKDVTDGEFEREWARAVTIWNEQSSDAECSELFYSSVVFENQATLVTVMASRGITWPKTADA